MKNTWLRGVLLGVSLALLLAGGVAVAQGYTIESDKPCHECFPGPGDPTEEYIVMITMNWPWPISDDLCYGVRLLGTTYAMENCFTPTHAGPAPMPWAIPCEPSNSEIRFLDGEVSLGNANTVEDLYGEWVWHLRNKVTGERVETSVLFAEDCLAEEFVPEPGTIMLLGSGLAGLAGYATLRWRARE